MDGLSNAGHAYVGVSMIPDSFTSYEALYERFEQEWQEIAIKFVNGEQI